MKELTADNVHAIFEDCLFKDGEDTNTAIKVEGIVCDYGFHPSRLASHKKEIGEMLSQLPVEFQKTGGAGMSFLSACMTASGVHWAEHYTMGQLFALGMATDQASYILPREMWKMFPGGMPYIVVNPKI